MYGGVSQATACQTGAALLHFELRLSPIRSAVGPAGVRRACSDSDRASRGDGATGCYRFSITVWIAELTAWSPPKISTVCSELACFNPAR